MGRVPTNGNLVLLCRVRRAFAALALEHVVETMRPLPVEPLADAPSFVSGLSIIRGAPTPVVDTGALLGFADDAVPTRFVTVKTGDRIVALAVEGVIDVRELSSESLDALPPLLADAASDVVSAVGTLDAELLVVLRAARAVPDSVWQVLDVGGGIL
jgi:purine-binding chemotaxis protein CheW